MAGKLQVVGTPIGNLEDCSPRTIRILSEADVILAEDTRKTRVLLENFGISLSGKKLLSCNAHNEKGRSDGVFSALGLGKNIALVSDCGAPCVSDPGGQMVQAVVEQGFDVEVIPGPSAPIAALMGAGLITTRFAFLGFLPLKGAERKRIVVDAARAGLALVIFESAPRIEKTLVDLFSWCGSQKVVVARELTKKFETFHRGILGGDLLPALVFKGEMVVVVEALSVEKSVQPDNLADLVNDELARVPELLALPSKEITKKIAEKLGCSRSVIYPLVVTAKNGLKNN